MVVIVQEPVDLWRQKGWLQSFYADPKNNALAFQILVYKTFVKAVQEQLLPFKDDPNAIVVCLAERSMWDQLLFWKLQVDLGRSCRDDAPLLEEFPNLNLNDAAYMEDWSLWMQCLPPVRRIFYCRTQTLEQTLERVWQRGRCEELGMARSVENLPSWATLGTKPLDWKRVSGIDYAYHKALREKHDLWFLPRDRPGKTGGLIKEANIDVTYVSMDTPFHKYEGELEKLAKVLVDDIERDLLLVTKATQ